MIINAKENIKEIIASSPCCPMVNKVILLTKNVGTKKKIIRSNCFVRIGTESL